MDIVKQLRPRKFPITKKNTRWLSRILNSIVKMDEENGAIVENVLRGVEVMRHFTPKESVLEASSLVGIVASFGLFYPAFFAPGWAILAVPACALFCGSMLYVTR